jgi:hypothetical protein
MGLLFDGAMAMLNTTLNADVIGKYIERPKSQQEKTCFADDLHSMQITSSKSQSSSLSMQENTCATILSPSRKIDLSSVDRTI